MRDIRSDLRERLEKVSAERRTLQTQLEELQTTENGIRLLLRQEEQHFSKLSPSLFPEGTGGTGTGLAQLIVAAMSVKHRPLDLEEIKEEMKKTPYMFGKKNPGRAIHFALVGLRESGMVERLEDKRWTIKHDNGIPVQESAN